MEEQTIDRAPTSHDFAESHRTLLCVLFGLFESLFLASVVILECLDLRKRPLIEDATGFAFWLAFIGLLIVCFILRRASRRVAVIGWLSLFVGFWFFALMPVL